MDVVDRCREAARELVAGRRVVLAGGPVAGFTAIVARLREMGSEPILVIADGIGTGPLPEPADASWVDLGIGGADPVAAFRAFERAVAANPPEVADAVEAYDPDRTAIVLVTPFQAVGAIAGRPAFGPRRPEWVALEDKTTCDALFDDAGVPRPPCEVVGAGDRDALLAAHGRVDRGDGTVWAGDARDGFNGGAVFVRRIMPVADSGVVDEAVAFFSARCDRVRVSPFLEGVPCSIHGIVLDDGVAVLRPVEMVTLRERPSGRLRYAGVATYWDPPDADREVMRSAARRVGALLGERVAFRGSFGLDGVLTADGWLPTEMNPRFGGGLGTISKGLPDFPLSLVHHLAAENGHLPVTAAELEETLVAAADGARSGGGWLTVSRAWDESEEHEAPGGTLLVGPSATGGFVRYTPAPGHVPVGESVAPAVCAAFAHADEALGAGIGPLDPCRPARTSELARKARPKTA